MVHEHQSEVVRERSDGAMPDRHALVSPAVRHEHRTVGVGCLTHRDLPLADNEGNDADQRQDAELRHERHAADLS